MSRLLAKSQPRGDVSPMELTMQPSGHIAAGDGCGVFYPRYIRNGTFQADQNGLVFSPAVNGGTPSRHITCGWHLRQGGGCEANSEVVTNNVKSIFPVNQEIEITSVGGTNSDFLILEQREFGIEQFAGRILTLEVSAYVSSGNRTIAVEFVADEGNGVIKNIPGGQLNLTRNNKTFCVTASVPNLSGTPLGIAPKIITRLWLLAGSDYDDRLGEGVSSTTGTVVITNVRDRSKTHTPSKQDEIRDCERYYINRNDTMFMSAAAKTAPNATCVLWIPWETAYPPQPGDVSFTHSFLTAAPSVSDISENGVAINATANNASSIGRITGFVLDAELTS